MRKPDPGSGENFTAGLTGELELPTWEVGDEEATRGAYGAALKALGGAREDVVALDGEVSNSTHSQEFAEEYPDRYFEMFIAEQQMVSAAVGMSVRHRVPFASSFAAFLSRAYDFIRMAAISRANIRLSGSHAGVSIGEDGPSQMALEDIAMMRAVHGSTVLQPCDANQTAKLVAEMADTGRHRVLEDAAPEDAGDLRPLRRLPHRRQQGLAILGRRRGNRGRFWHHRPRGHKGG